MVLGLLRFTEPPPAARQRGLPALPLSAVADLEDYVMWALPVTQERLRSAGSPAVVWRRAKASTVDLPSALRLIVAEAWPDVTVALRIGMIPPAPAWPGSAVTVIGAAPPARIDQPSAPGDAPAQPVRLPRARAVAIVAAACDAAAHLHAHGGADKAPGEGPEAARYDGVDRGEEAALPPCAHDAVAARRTTERHRLGARRREAREHDALPAGDWPPGA